jgi:succinylglutamate desuccinylase
MSKIANEIIGATKRPKLLIIWLHGDEMLGQRVGEYIVAERPDLLEHVDYICGNVVAAQQDPAVRYIDTDLNRSFNPAAEPKGYEEQRAQEILAKIRGVQYDYVLDLHTSTVEVDRFFLIDKRTKAIDEMIAASQVTRVIVMPEAIVQAALIGQAANAISIEYDREVAKKSGVAETIALIDDLISGQTQTRPQEREFFSVTRAIPKTEDPGAEAKNFELCKDGYYPVLFGEDAYRRDPKAKYLGFAAERVEKVSL